MRKTNDSSNRLLTRSNKTVSKQYARVRIKKEKSLSLNKTSLT